MTLPQDTPPDLGKLQSEMNAAVKAHWKAFLFEGIVLALLGLAAMIVPPLASLAVTIFLGWMFLIGGIAGLFATYWARQMPGFWWSLISAVLAVLAGGILLAKPEQGILTLTIVVGAYFLAERHHHSTCWSIAANYRSAGAGCWSPGRWTSDAALSSPGCRFGALGHWASVGINSVRRATLIGVALAARNS